MSCRRKHKKNSLQLACNVTFTSPQNTCVQRARAHTHTHTHTHTTWCKTKPLSGVPADDTHMAGSAPRTVCLYGNTSYATTGQKKFLVTPVSWPNSIIRCLHFQGKEEAWTLKTKPAGPSTTLATWRHIPEESKSHHVSNNTNISLLSSGNYVIFDDFRRGRFKGKVST
jgi:hypothetical protein